MQAIDGLPVYTDSDRVPRDLRSEAQLRAHGFVALGEPVALLTSGAGLGGAAALPAPATIPLYSTATARRLRGDDWARLQRRDSDAGRPDLPERGGKPAGGRASRDVAEQMALALGDVVRPPASRGAGISANPKLWLFDLFREGFVVVDTETTGLGARDEVVEIAAIASDGELLLQSLVKPRKARIQAAASRVNGLSAADLTDAPSWPEVSGVLQEALGGRRVLAWNAPFDERLSVQSSRAWGMAHDLPPFECAMRAYARFRGVGHGAIGLQRAAVIEGVACGAQTHRGVEDAVLVLAVLRRLRDVAAGSV